MIAQQTTYTYEIEPRPLELGGGYHLKLIINGQHVGGGIFPPWPIDDDSGDLALCEAMEEGKSWLTRGDYS